MPPGTEVDLGPGHIVLNGDQAAPPPKKRGTAAPFFLVDVYCGQRSPISATTELLLLLFCAVVFLCLG